MERVTITRVTDGKVEIVRTTIERSEQPAEKPVKQEGIAGKIKTAASFAKLMYYLHGWWGNLPESD